MNNRAIALTAMLLLAAALRPVSAQVSVQAVDVMGDSISRGFNAVSGSPCPNSDQEGYNWLTGRTHGALFCAAGPENVFSVLERMECDAGMTLFSPASNHAMSGATLVRDLVTQANNVKTYLTSQPVERMAVMFIGHNDNCSGTANKTNASCSSIDMDPANYCKTTPEAFERELRKGLDVLITTGNTRIAVMAPVRVSQLCNFAGKTNCQLGGSCQFLWSLAGICAPLTRDCSAQRIVDTYTTLRSYRDILRSVSMEYAAIRVGSTSPVVIIGGQTVGGATLAEGTTIVYSDAAWFYRFSSNQLSCCDCFHPSAAGQDTMARLAKSGLACSRINPCCKDTGDTLADGKCATLQRKSAYYPGLF